MNRRTFLQNTALVALGAPLLTRAASAAASSKTPSSTPTTDARLARIGITTVCLRSYFPSTRTLMAEPNTAPALTLETAPAFILDHFGLRNVEVWDLHFSEQTIGYCERVRAAAERIGSRISNIQVDELADLSAPDPAQRALGVKQAKAWADRAVALGAPSFRVNTGGEDGQKFLVDVTADSFRRIADYAGERGVILLVENHTGFSADIDHVVALLAKVNHPHCRALADFGNSPAGTTAVRLAGLQKMFPSLAFVSAKGTGFNDRMEHSDYDFGALVRGTEASGYRGIYSIEMWPGADRPPPADPLRAGNWMKDTILANLRA